MGSRLIVESLKKQGVKAIFGIPGLYNMPVYDAFLEDVESGQLRHILMRHEQAAAHAADAYARATGFPGVCTATSGPGVTNLVTGLITAYQDSSPVVAITGQVNSSSIGKMSFQESDTPGIMFPVTKYTVQLRSVDEIPFWIEKAFYIASTGRPGPVVVDIPRDLQNTKIDDLKSLNRKLNYKPFRTIVDRDRISKALSLLLNAERPIMLVGTGVAWSGATDEVIKLSKMLGMPVVSTLPGKSSMPADYPLYLGAMGYYGKAEASMAALESDVMLVVGARLSDRTFTSYNEMAETGKKFIEINIDPGDFMKGIKPDIGIQGDSKLILKEMIKNIPEHALKHKNEWTKRVKELKDYYEKFYYIEDRKLKPFKILKTIRESLPRDAIMTTGVGQHQMWAEVFWENLEPRSFFSSTGMGTMGFGLPAAIGAKVGRPDKIVVDFDGDGSFLMTGNNLAVAVDYNIPVIAIVNDNRTLGLVRQVQDMFQNKRIVGVDYGNSPDLVKYAEAFGALGFDVENYDDIKNAIKTAIKEDVPAVIRVPVDKEELALPTLPPGGKLREMIVSDPRKKNNGDSKLP
ncbi:acetolactate synthase large subunit [Picrophilus oshimae]|uniref:Acetolactate synthase n=1 Tax=Picrophilus torridus (strain ATCC 700027 / DSM 9790 / JCM 10055 / NBRC 100828 / KAW 2/3) TaxID=1122961 RepID=A0A8G2L7R2_PICTO|nr:acetolactate synthase large subunit [Picrophilus oshimae]SMD31285.1 acetolactate synthase, large subunit [Picrophilus oshimae DSM 9789]